MRAGIQTAASGPPRRPRLRDPMAHWLAPERRKRCQACTGPRMGTGACLAPPAKKEADPEVRLALWLQVPGWARRPTPLPGG